MPEQKITLAHGNGGTKTAELIQNVFLKHFNDPALNQLGDSAVLPAIGENIAISTDSFVVHPQKFRGGDIGKLAVCGTVNDLAVAGAEPLFLTAGFILEEGLDIEELELFVESMAQTASEAGVRIVTGDTKVVRRGECDKLYINTAGIGLVKDRQLNISNGSLIQAGDEIIVNGSIGDHGMAIYAERFPENIRTPIKSDCACLNGLIKKILDSGIEIHFMRDATRGGLAGVLNEVSSMTGFDIRINENEIPVNIAVNGMCELLGFDPLQLANEGKVVILAKKGSATQLLDICHSTDHGKNAALIGEVDSLTNKKVILKTRYGGSRIVDQLSGDQLPRIC